MKNSSDPFSISFLGDNNFLLDRLWPVEHLKPAYWFVPIGPSEQEGLHEHVFRLTITINRQDMSQTQSSLFAPGCERTCEIPTDAWVEVGYP